MFFFFISLKTYLIKQEGEHDSDDVDDDDDADNTMTMTMILKTNWLNTEQAPSFLFPLFFHLSRLNPKLHMVMIMMIMTVIMVVIVIIIMEVTIMISKRKVGCGTFL